MNSRHRSTTAPVSGHQVRRNRSMAFALAVPGAGSVRERGRAQSGRSRLASRHGKCRRPMAHPFPAHGAAACRTAEFQLFPVLDLVVSAIFCEGGSPVEKEFSTLSPGPTSRGAFRSATAISSSATPTQVFRLLTSQRDNPGSREESAPAAPASNAAPSRSARPSGAEAAGRRARRQAA